jgi:5-methylthioadenosine/S-adenosylhomocysteine deaminase
MLTLAQDASTSFRGDIAIEGDRIVEVGERVEPRNGDHDIDASDRIVIPGLVNGHLHSAEGLFRGRYENLPLELWGPYAYPFLPTEPISARLIELRTLAVAIESLKSGVTCVLDDVIQAPGQELDGLAAVFGAYRLAGLRANISLRMVDRSWLDTLPFAHEIVPESLMQVASSGGTRSAGYYLDLCKAAFADLHRPNDGLRFVVAPSAPQRCTPELLEGAAALAEQHDSPLHIHLLETRVQAVAGKAFYGTTLGRYLANLGVLHERTTLAHAIWLSADDLEAIAASGACVVHNPISNLKLGSGIAPYDELRRHEIPIALGTDGVSSNDSTRMFEVMKFAALLHDVSTPDFDRWPRAEDIFVAATRGGARSVGIRDLGTLAPGQLADIVLVDATTVSFSPLNKLVNHLVYSENGSSVRTVFVGGQIVVDEGRCIRFNEEDILAETRELASEFLERHLRTEAAHAVFEPYFREIWERAFQTPVELSSR